MGCLSSENLKEREEVLGSAIMIAQRTGEYLVYIAHFHEGEASTETLALVRMRCRFSQV